MSGGLPALRPGQTKCPYGHGHDVPMSGGFSGSAETSLSVYCGRCRESVAVTVEWIRAHYRNGSYRNYGKPGVKVVVDGGLTYRWPDDDDIHVGDRVLLPGNEYRSPRIATIQSVGSDYDGYLVDILEKVR